MSNFDVRSIFIFKSKSVKKLKNIWIWFTWLIFWSLCPMSYTWGLFVVSDSRVVRNFPTSSIHWKPLTGLSIALHIIEFSFLVSATRVISVPVATWMTRLQNFTGEFYFFTFSVLWWCWDGVDIKHLDHLAIFWTLGWKIKIKPELLISNVCQKIE